MEKLNLHETLRIYVPGLFAAILIHLLVTQTFKDIGQVLLPAIFLGFVLNYFTHTAVNNRFIMIVSSEQIKLSGHEQLFDDHLTDILKAKSDKYNTRIDADLVPKSSFLQKSFFAKLYETNELLYFRGPKSWGTMCYTLFLAALVIPVLFLLYSIWNQKEPFDFQKLMLTSSLIASAVFYAQSKIFFVDSLTRELHYWATIAEDDCKKLEAICETDQGLKDIFEYKRRNGNT